MYLLINWTRLGTRFELLSYNQKNFFFVNIFFIFIFLEYVYVHTHIAYKTIAEINRKHLYYYNN